MKRSFFASGRAMAAAAFLAACCLLAACTGKSADPKLEAQGKSFLLKGVTGLEQIAQLTGEASPNKTDQYAVYGTDLGSMINAGDRTYFVFGDTFGERPPDQIGGGGSFWRSNTMAWSTDTDPSDGITLDGMITDELGLAAELLPSVKRDYEEMTKIPTHGLYANGHLYLYYMSVNHWGEPGHWDANYSSVAKSTDGGYSWTLLDQVQWPGDSNFIQVSPCRVTDEEGRSEFYFWGIPSGRFGGVKLMKAAESDLERIDGYRYFAGLDEEGRPLWSADADEAALIVDDAVGELSVIWNEPLQRWLMTYLNEDRGVVIREGLTPWGPWGEAIDLVPFYEYPGLYAPFMNDRFMSADGKTIYFTLSLWDPYNVFWFKADLQL